MKNPEEPQQSSELVEHKGKDTDQFSALHERLDQIEKHLGLNKAKPSKEEALRQRRRS